MLDAKERPLTVNPPSGQQKRKSLGKRLTEQSLINALSRIDPAEEPNWFLVACILANSWGEGGRTFFLQFSKGAYWANAYERFDEREANAKFDRALREQEGRETLAGANGLLKMADLRISDVEFVDISPEQILDDTEKDQLARQRLAQEFALINLGGQIRVVESREVAMVQSNQLARGVSLYQRKDAELLMRRSLASLHLPQSNSIIANFFIDPNTIFYAGTAFHPLTQPENILNYWRSPIAPLPGEGIEPITEFLHDVICAGDKRLSEYLLDFLAHMLQKPEVKPGIIVALLGGQGVGKGTFFKLLQGIWKSSVMVVQDIDQVVGRFNSALERSYVVCMDEAMFRGDRKASERLKSLATEPVVRLEEKYEPARTIESFHRFFAATNSKHFGQVDVDDRRYLFLRVSDHRRCDHDYFGQLNNLLRDDLVMAAFAHTLLKRNIESVNIYGPPLPEENVLQRVQSLQGFPRFWHDFLVQEGVSADGESIATRGLIISYREFCSREERFSPLQTNQISKHLREMCPSAHSARVTTATHTGRRGYAFPPIAVCRKEFEAYIGAKLDWDICPGERGEPIDYF